MQSGAWMKHVADNEADAEWLQRNGEAWCGQADDDARDDRRDDRDVEVVGTIAPLRLLRRPGKWGHSAVGHLLSPGVLSYTARQLRGRCQHGNLQREWL